MTSFRDALITTLPPLLLAASLQAGAAEAMVEPATPKCRLTTSKDTKDFYPAGLLDLAVKNCWAGPDTDIKVISKQDIIQGSRHHITADQNVLATGRAAVLDILPADTRALFQTVVPEERDALLNRIVLTSLSPGSGHAVKYRFNDDQGNLRKNVFFATVENSFYNEERLAAMAGVSFASHLSSDVLYADASEPIHVRSATLTHELRHGANNDGLTTIRGNRIDRDKIPSTTAITKLSRETAADRGGHEYYAQAIAMGIELDPERLLIDQRLRALSAFFSYRPQDREPDEKAEEEPDYQDLRIKGYLDNPNPVPIHATTAGLGQRPLPSPEQQSAGVLLFREKMTQTLGELFYNSAEGRMYNHDENMPGKTEIEYCGIDLDKLPVDFLKVDAPAPRNAASYVGNCVASDMMVRGVAINAIIALENKEHKFDNPIAQNYFEDFRDSVLSGTLSRTFMNSAAGFYAMYQRAELTDSQVRQRWDGFFIRHDLMEPPAPSR